MWGLTIIVSAFALALMAMTLGFFGGAAVVAIPVAILAVGVAAGVDFQRRRKQAMLIHRQREHADERDVDFSARDRESLISE